MNESDSPGLVNAIVCVPATELTTVAVYLAMLWCAVVFVRALRAGWGPGKDARSMTTSRRSLIFWASALCLLAAVDFMWCLAGICRETALTTLSQKSIVSMTYIRLSELILKPLPPAAAAGVLFLTALKLGWKIDDSGTK